MKPIDITGKRFGRLVAVGYVRSVLQGKKKRQFWLFRCDCGQEAVMQKGSVTGGKVVSCGCHRQANFPRANENRRQAALVAQPVSSLKAQLASITAEQRANRAVVPPSMRGLPSRMIPSRHVSGQSVGMNQRPMMGSSAGLME